MQGTRAAFSFLSPAVLLRPSSFHSRLVSRDTFRTFSPSRSLHATPFRVAMATSEELNNPSQAVANSFMIALCQTPVTPDKEKNLSVARDYLLRAHAAGAKLAVLPECFNCPYDTACFRDYAEELPAVGFKPSEAHSSPSLQMLQTTAQETEMYIVGGSVPEISADGKVYNCSLSVSPDGVLVAKHRKVHLFDIDVPGGIRFKESDVLSPGASATAFDAHDVSCTVGVGICYDVRFPEMAMIQTRDLGAKLLVFPGAFNMTTGPAHWELLLRARALDNQVFVAACSPSRNESNGGYTAWGHSMVVDPWGTVLASAEEKPEMVLTKIDLGRLDGVRNAIPTSKQRRGDIYKLQYVA